MESVAKDILSGKSIQETLEGISDDTLCENLWSTGEEWKDIILKGVRQHVKAYEYLAVGKILCTKCYFAEAIPFFEKAMSHGWESYIEIGYCYEMLKNYEKAEEIYHKQEKGEQRVDSLMRLLHIKLAMYKGVKEDIPGAIRATETLLQVLREMQQKDTFTFYHEPQF
jgi:tetratricopeptide (TPR) repeat protein